jgi:hypothetical protein
MILRTTNAGFSRKYSLKINKNMDVLNYALLKQVYCSAYERMKYVSIAIGVTDLTC